MRIGGYDIFEQPEKAKRLIGYLPEQPPLYQNETPLEYLRFVGEAKGLHGMELTTQIADAVARTGIEKVQNRKIAALSKGYKQRVGIAQVLLGKPEIIILDEPTVGLDPIQIIEIRNLVKELGKTHTVIFSFHILSEVQAICDKILIISKGKLTALGTPAELERQQRTDQLLYLLPITTTQMVLGEIPRPAGDVSDPAGGHFPIPAAVLSIRRRLSAHLLWLPACVFPDGCGAAEKVPIFDPADSGFKNGSMTGIVTNKETDSGVCR